MHLNTASSLSVLRPDFLFGALLLHYHSIHFLYNNPVKGKSDKVTCLSCFRGLLERAFYSKLYFLAYHPSAPWKRRFVIFFFFSWSRSVTTLLSWSKLPYGEPGDVGCQQGKSPVTISLSLRGGKTMGCEFRERRRRPAMLLLPALSPSTSWGCSWCEDATELLEHRGKPWWSLWSPKKGFQVHKKLFLDYDHGFYLSDHTMSLALLRSIQFAACIVTAPKHLDTSLCPFS